MDTPTHKRTYFYSPLPRYTFYDSDNPDNNRDEWVHFWHVPNNAKSYYHYFLSKLENGGDTTLPMSDEEVADKVGVTARIVSEARRACEHAGLIERIHDSSQKRGVYIYRLPPSITTQKGKNDSTRNLRTEGETVRDSRTETSNSTDISLRDSRTDYVKPVNSLRDSRTEDSEPQSPEATPPQASEPVAQDLRLFLDLNLDILDSIRDVLIFNTEQKNGKYMSVRAKESMGKELVEKLSALTQEFCEYDAGDVLIVCRGLAEEKVYRSPWMYRTENHGVLEDIREELEGAQGRDFALRGDTKRMSKRDVPDDIIIKWIDAMVEEKQFVEMKEVGGNYEAVLEERTEEEKQDLRDTLAAAHDEGEIDYHEISGWNERGGTEINRSETKLRSKGIIYHGVQNKNGFHSLGDVLKEAAQGDNS